MRSNISFCPLCAGKLEADEDDDQFRCLECESQFLIQLVEEDEDEDEDEEEDEDEDDDDDREKKDDDDDD